MIDLYFWKTPNGHKLESAAILQYLADKFETLLQREGVAGYEVLQWLFWQVGGLVPMAGQTPIL